MKNKKTFTLFFAVLAIFSLYACGKDKQPQAPEVTVNAIKLTAQDAPLNLNYPAQIAGSMDIEVRAQVGGILKSREYVEGSYVQKGAPLFIIDPQPYQVALEKAQGALAQADSEVKRTKREYERMRRLFKENAVSAKEHDDALSAYETAKADYQVAQAGVNDAQINLGYTTVSAPIDGLTGKEMQSEGSLIVANAAQASLLTTMVKTDPLYINFSMPSRDWNLGPKTKKAGKIETSIEDIKVKVVFDDGSVYPQDGKIFFVDNTEDVKTSSIAFKAELPNPNLSPLLLPGKFVRVRLEGFSFKDALVAPISALVPTDNGYNAYVVNAQNVVEIKPVKASVGGTFAFISGGLAAGDIIMTEGMVKVKAGQKVNVNLQEFSVISNDADGDGKPDDGGYSDGSLADAPHAMMGDTSTAAAEPSYEGQDFDPEKTDIISSAQPPSVAPSAQPAVQPAVQNPPVGQGD